MSRSVKLQKKASFTGSKLTYHESEFHFATTCEIPNCKTSFRFGGRSHCRVCGFSVCGKHIFENVILTSTVTSLPMTFDKVCNLCIIQHESDEVMKNCMAIKIQSAWKSYCDNMKLGDSIDGSDVDPGLHSFEKTMSFLSDLIGEDDDTDHNTTNETPTRSSMTLEELVTSLLSDTDHNHTEITHLTENNTIVTADSTDCTVAEITAPHEKQSPPTVETVSLPIAVDSLRSLEASVAEVHSILAQLQLKETQAQAALAAMSAQLMEEKASAAATQEAHGVALAVLQSELSALHSQDIHSVVEITALRASVQSMSQTDSSSAHSELQHTIDALHFREAQAGERLSEVQAKIAEQQTVIDALRSSTNEVTADAVSADTSETSPNSETTTPSTSPTEDFFISVNASILSETTESKQVNLAEDHSTTHLNESTEDKSTISPPSCSAVTRDSLRTTEQNTTQSDNAIELVVAVESHSLASTPPLHEEGDSQQSLPVTFALLANKDDSMCFEPFVDHAQHRLDELTSHFNHSGDEVECNTDDEVSMRPYMHHTPPPSKRGGVEEVEPEGEERVNRANRVPFSPVDYSSRHHTSSNRNDEEEEGEGDYNFDHDTTPLVRHRTNTIIVNHHTDNITDTNNIYSDCCESEKTSESSAKSLNISIHHAVPDLQLPPITSTTTRTNSNNNINVDVEDVNGAVNHTNTNNTNSRTPQSGEAPHFSACIFDFNTWCFAVGPAYSSSVDGCDESASE